MRKAYILCEHANTPRCVDSRKILEEIGFQVHCIPYIRHRDKVYSNKISMQMIYEKIIQSGDEWSYVFEDDINKVTDITLKEIMEYEKISSHVFYLGSCCLDNGITKSNIKISGHPVSVINGGSLGLHAVAFSRKGMIEFLQFSQNSEERYMDVILNNFTKIHNAYLVRYDLECPFCPHTQRYYLSKSSKIPYYNLIKSYILLQ
jgi:hypothetical protein